MDFDIRQLRYFAAIAEAGSFSRAGAQLGIAQSALSHHIGQMEGRLGVDLFARSSKGVVLTESGRRFLEHARSILAAVEAAANDVRDDAGRPGGLIRMGFTLSLAPAMVGPLMGEVSGAAPRVTLRVEERISPLLVQAIGDNEIDVAVCYNAADNPRVDAAPLFEENICLVGAPGLVGEADTPVELEEALSHPLLLPGRDHFLRGMIDRLALFRNHPITVRHECLSLQSLFSGLEQGLGATLVSRFSALPLLRSKKVVCRDIADPAISRRLFLATSAERPATAAQALVADIAAGFVARQVGGGEWPGTRPVRVA